MNNDFVLLLTQDIDETQRRLIQNQVKEHADEWWHQFLDVWIVRTNKPPEWWRDLLKIFLPSDDPGELLVFQLPPPGKRKWSVWARRPKWIWLLRTYASSGGGSPNPDAPELRPV